MSESLPASITTPPPLTRVNAFTNQQLIDAFFDAANALHNGNYEGLLARVGLDLHQLAADRSGRYHGPTLAHLPTLSPDELAHIHHSLIRQLTRRAQPGYVNAPAGLNLRTGPTREDVLLVSLPLDSTLAILTDAGEWLLVQAGAHIGWAFAEYVTRGTSSMSGGGGIGHNGTGDNGAGDHTTLITTHYTGPLAPATLYTLPANSSPHLTAAAATWHHYGALIEHECRRLNLDPAVAVAILGVESSGRAFEGERMVIRFENHIFLHYWGRTHRELFDRHFTASSDGTQHRWRPDPNGEWLPCHSNQTTEWQAFTFARGLDESAAMYAISMGAAQIMGFNHTSIGYATVQTMFNAFQSDVRHQLSALFRFIEVNHLEEAVRAANFTRFASTYNGQGQEHIYAPRMQQYYDAFRQLVALNRGEAVARLPRPSGPPLLQADPELLAAWRKHVASSLANNETVFHQLLKGFMRPYWTTVWMYRILFALGVIAFLLAAGLAIFANRPLAVITFGGVSAIAIFGYFFNRPLAALEQNLQFLTWLGIVYNSYWTRLTLLDNESTVQNDITLVTDEAIDRIRELVAEHAQRSHARPTLPNPFDRS